MPKAEKSRSGFGRRSHHTRAPGVPYKKPEPKAGILNTSNLYAPRNSQAGRALPRSKASEIFDCGSIYSFVPLVQSYRVDVTPPKLGRLALAASRESRSSKKEFESYVRRTRNHAFQHIEEPYMGSEVDGLASCILRDVAVIGRSGCETTRATFEHALLSY